MSAKPYNHAAKSVSTPMEATTAHVNLGLY